MAKLYFLLIGVIERSNLVFGFSISIFICSYLLKMTFIIFKFYLLFSKNVNTLGGITFSFVNNFPLVLMTIILIHCCELVKKEDEITFQLTYEGALNSKNSKTKRKLKIFILQLKHTRVRFSSYSSTIGS